MSGSNNAVWVEELPESAENNAYDTSISARPSTRLHLSSISKRLDATVSGLAHSIYLVGTYT